MRKTLIIAGGAAAALVTAAVAVAAVYTAVGVSPTTATLSTDTYSAKTRTCTGGDGASFAITEGRYVGKADFATPATDLDGAITISARITQDTTTTNTNSKIGYVEGSFRIKDGESRVTGRLWGTLDKSNKLSGFLVGASRGNHARVFGTLNGTFDPAKGFTSPATVGSGSTSAALAVVAGPVCKNPKPAPKPKRLEIQGRLSLGTGAVSVTRNGFTATCSIDNSSPSLTGFAKDDWVEMKCENAGSGWLLRGLKKHSPQPRLSSVEGQVLAVGNGSIGSTIAVKAKGPSVATCTLDKDSPSTAGFTVGTKVEMKCAYLGTAPNQVWTLRTLKKDD